MNDDLGKNDRYFSGTQLESDELPDNHDSFSCTQVDDNVCDDFDQLGADEELVAPNSSGIDRYPVDCR